MLKPFDIVVAGAGPAGSAAAILLARAGLQVAQVDELNPEAWKLGESVPGAINRLLQRLGIAGVQDLLGPNEYMPCAAKASAWHSAEWDYRSSMLDPEGGGWMLLRHRFDQALLAEAQKAGAELLLGRIHKVDHQQERGRKALSFALKVGKESLLIEADWLIDATGRSANPSRRLGAVRQRITEQVAAYTWLKPVDTDLDNTTRVKRVDDGWWYTARLPNGYRVVGFHGLAQAIGRMLKEPDCFCEALNATDLLPHQAKISPVDFHKPLQSHDAGISRLEQPFGNHWLAIGDAALSFDPLSSQGIYFALYSAIRGCEALLRGLQSPEGFGNACLAYSQKVDSVYEANRTALRRYYGA